MITRTIHQFWCNHTSSDDEPPEDVKKVLNETRLIFKDYKYVLWNNELISTLLARSAPGYLDTYNAINIPALRSDLARLVVLYFNGGVYLDATIRPVSSHSVSAMDYLMENFELVVAESREDPSIIMNRFIVATKGCLHIRRVMDICFINISRSIERGDTRIDVWDLAGSQLSRYINGQVTAIRSLERIDFDSAIQLFTRISCDYKNTPLGCWQDLQTGAYYSIYSQPELQCPDTPTSEN